MGRTNYINGQNLQMEFSLVLHKQMRTILKQGQREATSNIKSAIVLEKSSVADDGKTHLVRPRSGLLLQKQALYQEWFVQFPHPSRSYPLQHYPDTMLQMVGVRINKVGVNT